MLFVCLLTEYVHIGSDDVFTLHGCQAWCLNEYLAVASVKMDLGSSSSIFISAGVTNTRACARHPAIRISSCLRNTTCPAVLQPETIRCAGGVILAMLTLGADCCSGILKRPCETCDGTSDSKRPAATGHPQLRAA